MPKRSFAPPDSGPARQEPTPPSPPVPDPPAAPDPPPAAVAAEPEAPPEPAAAPRELPARETPPAAGRVAPPLPPPLLPERPVVDPRSHTASELTEYTIVRRRSDKPGSGWRRAVHVASVGLVNPGIGPAE